MRQWTATDRPRLACSCNRLKRASNSATEAGTDRSSIGNETKSISFWQQSALSWDSPSSSDSAGVSADTITSTPVCFRNLMSSASQSHPLGRGIVPNRRLRDCTQHGVTVLLLDSHDAEGTTMSARISAIRFAGGAALRRRRRVARLRLHTVVRSRDVSFSVCRSARHSCR